MKNNLLIVLLLALAAMATPGIEAQSLQNIVRNAPKRAPKTEQPAKNPQTPRQQQSAKGQPVKEKTTADSIAAAPDIKVEVVEAPSQAAKMPAADKVYAAVEEMPTFPGGDAAMYKWLGEHLNYPADAAKDDIQGKVVVQFIVEKDGSITAAKVMRGKHPSLDKEALRVVRAMPRWNPGKNNGQPVRATYILPITFRMQGY